MISKKEKKKKKKKKKKKARGKSERSNKYSVFALQKH